MENPVGLPIVYLSFPKSTSIYMAYAHDQDKVLYVTNCTYWGIFLDYYNVYMYLLHKRSNDLSEYKRKLNNM